MEAPAANLTFFALMGKAICPGCRETDMATFMEKKGYNTEARYIRTVSNWHRACDERGLSELQRCHYNYDFLHYVLCELMPWYKVWYHFRSQQVYSKVRSH